MTAFVPSRFNAIRALSVAADRVDDFAATNHVHRDRRLADRQRPLFGAVVLLRRRTRRPERPSVGKRGLALFERHAATICSWPLRCASRRQTAMRYSAFPEPVAPLSASARDTWPRFTSSRIHARARSISSSVTLSRGRAPGSFSARSSRVFRGMARVDHETTIVVKTENHDSCFASEIADSLCLTCRRKGTP